MYSYETNKIKFSITTSRREYKGGFFCCCEDQLPKEKQNIIGYLFSYDVIAEWNEMKYK